MRATPSRIMTVKWPMTISCKELSIWLWQRFIIVALKETLGFQRTYIQWPGISHQTSLRHASVNLGF